MLWQQRDRENDNDVGKPFALTQRGDLHETAFRLFVVRFLVR